MSKTPRTDATLNSQPNGGFGLDKGQCIAQWYDFASQLERENAELRKDAERYRWLRVNGDAFIFVIATIEQQEKGMGPLVLAQEERLDNAIDAESKRQQEAI